MKWIQCFVTGNYFSCFELQSVINQQNYFSAFSVVSWTLRDKPSATVLLSTSELCVMLEMYPFSCPILRVVLTCCANSEAASAGYSSLGFWHISRSQIKENWVGQALFFSQEWGFYPAQASFLFPSTLLDLWECYKMRCSDPVLTRFFFSWPTVAVFSYCWPIFLLFKVPVD